MKVPSRWLADYVEIEITHEAIDRLAERLTLAGLEVEDVHGWIRSRTPWSDMSSLANRIPTPTTFRFAK